MRSLVILAAVFTFVTMCAGPGFTLASSQPYPAEGRIAPITTTAEKRPDLEAVMNFPGRVYGDHGFFSEIGEWENLFFRGGTEAFNRFLALCAAIKTKPIRLTVLPGRGVTSGMFGAEVKPVPCDWRYTRHIAGSKRGPNEPDETVSVEVWTEGQVDVSKMVVPAGFVVSRDPRAVAEGDIVFDKAIPLKMSVGAQDTPDIVQLKSITFTRKDGHVWAEFETQVLSWPKGKWALHLSVTDEKGTVIKGAEAVIENSGIIAGRPGIDKTPVRLDLGPSADLAAARRYFVELAVAAEPPQAAGEQSEQAEAAHDSRSAEGDIVFDKAIALAVSAGTPGNPDIARLKSVTFTREDDHVWATLETEVLSGPKGGWALHFALLNEKGHTIKQATTNFENSGIIDRVGEIKKEPIRFDLGPAGYLVDARRFWVGMDYAYSPEITKFRADRQAQLDRIAKAVSELSSGKAELMIKAEVSANPTGGNVVRRLDWAGTPFVTVYPTSVPYDVELEGIGRGKVFGAVALLTDAAAREGKEKAPAGVYLLFEPRLADAESDNMLGLRRSRPVYLVGVSEQSGKLAYSKVLEVQAQYASVMSPELDKRPYPHLEVGFPTDKVQPGDPAWRAYVCITWPADTYFFQFDMEIMMV